MGQRDELRHEYLERICAALTEYVDDGLPLHIHSRQRNGTLTIMFSLGQPDTFHDLVEGRRNAASEQLIA